MQNHLKNQTSPYLLQHADNPVHWYPWCGDAFKKAKEEDKPIFLSIGYSTCHWCHVMAHESFEDEAVAEILNKYFVSIKVDKEERPDIDSIYMAVCQTFTGSGGWPTTIFLTPDQKPFFAGTYFPKTARYGQIGFIELLKAVVTKWNNDREALAASAEDVVSHLNAMAAASYIEDDNMNYKLIDDAVNIFKRIFDHEYGGFGGAPKFPTPHNLMFLMKYYEKNNDDNVLKMVEKTLIQMYRGGMFDHIGGGFSRYSTDKYFFAPHFEKMLYDNALLIMAYCRAYAITGKKIYCEVAKKTALYILCEMTHFEGGFYSAQDADSEGVEGKYYLFDTDEIIEIIGKDIGREFNKHFNITKQGNFEGRNIPNLLYSDMNIKKFDKYFQDIYEYRVKRYSLHLDDKILTSWNGLMIAAMCNLYRITGDKTYLEVAIEAQEFIEEKLCYEDILYVSYRNGEHSGRGFLDDYANEIYALLALYEATLDSKYIAKAELLCKKAINDFYDHKQGGFFLSGDNNERLILRPKETYDGAVFSGNSAMAYNLVRLYYITHDKKYEELAEKQLGFMSAKAKEYPAGYAMFLMALYDYLEEPDKVTIVLKNTNDLKDLPCKISFGMIVNILDKPSEEYKLKDNKTTFYVCEGKSCKPPVNEL